ncbi:hypothetical protein IDM30_02220 [Acinetobacter seifertii]|nr:hypothetical protein [Acinetobacter seifertii]
MKRNVTHSFLLGLCAITLSACQSTYNVVDTVRIKQAKHENLGQNAAIYCSGAKSCEFERLNDITVVDAQTRRIVITGIVRLNGSLLSQSNSLYLSVPAKQYEVVIRFYPISPDRAETIHVIHQFKANHRYMFKMYRDKSNRSGSLLNVSVPDPLCVDLEQDGRVIRRFCRPFDVTTGLGEFLEQKKLTPRQS